MPSPPLNLRILRSSRSPPRQHRTAPSIQPVTDVFAPMVAGLIWLAGRVAVSVAHRLSAYAAPVWIVLALDTSTVAVLLVIAGSDAEVADTIHLRSLDGSAIWLGGAASVSIYLAAWATGARDDGGSPEVGPGAKHPFTWLQRLELCASGPLAEELILRGLFVGAPIAAGAPAVVAIVGAALPDLLVHCHQGVQNVPFHVFAHVVWSVLLLGPADSSAP